MLGHKAGRQGTRKEGNKEGQREVCFKGRKGGWRDAKSENKYFLMHHFPFP